MFGDNVLRQQIISTDLSLFASIKNFTDDRKAKSNTKRTINYYVSELNLFSNWLEKRGLANLPIEKISSNIIRQFMNTK